MLSTSAQAANIPQSHYCYILEVKVNFKTIYKIGYTSDIRKRIRGLNNLEGKGSQVKGKHIRLESIIVLALATLNTMEEAKGYEAKLHAKYKPHKYIGLTVLPNGNTELYKVNIADLELIDETTLFIKYA